MSSNVHAVITQCVCPLTMAWVVKETNARRVESTLGLTDDAIIAGRATKRQDNLLHYQEERKVGFLDNLAKSVAQSAHDRVQSVSETKSKFEDKYQYASDEELFSMMRHISVSSSEFAALSLILQENRGYSSEDIVKRVKHR